MITESIGKFYVWYFYKQTNKKCKEYASFNIKRHDGFLFIPSYIKHIGFACPLQSLRKWTKYEKKHCLFSNVGLGSLRVLQYSLANF